jgi:hypothetical protein
MAFTSFLYFLVSKSIFPLNHFCDPQKGFLKKEIIEVDKIDKKEKWNL